jgi:uncharacterized protein
MIGPTILLVGGFFCGLLAGGAAQFGRLCTLSAIEDAAVAGDFRRARAFTVALATALLTTQLFVTFGVLDLSSSPYAQSRIELLGLICGAFLFGLGMSLAGTCGFGLLIRMGTGDLRAFISAGVLGIAAAAATGGILSPLRLTIANLWIVDTSSLPLPAFPYAAWLRTASIDNLAITVAIVSVLVGWSVASVRFRRRRNLILAGLGLGLSVTLGWIVTGPLADPFGAHRLESLTFVAPIARALFLTMGENITSASFAVATVVGVVIGSCAVTWYRDETRWQAFDDAREMRRHLIGALLMGFGGVLAKGCTIGQGLSASSTLAATAPIAILFMILGARLGLFYLIEGRTLWGSLVTGTNRNAG